MNDIDNILEQGINNLMPSINMRLPGITSRVIKTKSQQCYIPAGRASYADLIRFLEQRGELLAQYDSNNMAAAIIRGGFLSMNPALVICSLTGEQGEQGAQVWVSVYAKEGLIKQHTAEKLIVKFCEEFEGEFGNMMLEQYSR